MVGITQDSQDAKEQVLQSADPLAPFYNQPGDGKNSQENTMAETIIVGASTMRHVVEFCSHAGHDVSIFVSTAWAGLAQQLAETERVSAIAQHRGTIQSLSKNVKSETICRELLNPDCWDRCEDLAVCDDGQYHIGIIVDEICCQTSDKSLFERCPLILTANASQLMLRYPNSKQNRPYAQNIASMLAAAIGSLLVDQDQTLASIQCFTIEHMKLLQTWNGGRMLEPPTSFLHQRIHELAVQQSRKTAVLGPDATLTYAQLDSASSTLALHISSLGVTNNMMVGVSFPKSAWAVVSMLAINKIGAAFVPLDTSHPLSRLKYITKEAGITWLLTSTEKASSFVDIVQNVHIVSAMSFNESSLPAEPWLSPARPTDPAYCFFTSGSTGVPKGCVVSHEALSSVSCHRESLHLQATSRVFQFASFSFGISLIEIWCTLTAGATVCMPSNDDRLNNLTGAISEMTINWAFMTATVVGSLSPDNVPSLQTIVIAGEPLQKAQISTWAKAVSLLQGYGLTEWAGVCSVSARVVSEDDQKNIGYAANGRLWVVNQHNAQKLAPVGAVGELVVEGPSLASGYLNHPAKTDAAFLVDPSWLNGFPRGSDAGSSRVYKTGDLVQYNTDGTLNYIGRKDTQIKIRGQRVEVGEIESHATQLLPDAQKVVVEGVRTQGTDGQQVLTAFIVTSRAQSNDSELFVQVHGKLKQAVDYCRLRLTERLPSYMVPEAFLALRWVN